MRASNRLVSIVLLFAFIGGPLRSGLARRPVSASMGEWVVVPDPGNYGNSADWSSAGDGWSFFAQGEWRTANFYHWDGRRWEFAQELPYSSGESYIFEPDVEAVSSQDAWAVAIKGHHPQAGGSTFFHWDGERWMEGESIPYVHIQDMHFFSPDSGWAAGSGSNETRLFHWDGAVWQELFHLPHTALQGELAMVSEREGWVIDYYGEIGHYRDGEWELHHSPVGGGLTGIAMTSAADGWIIGERGLLLHWTGSGSWEVFPLKTEADLKDIHMVSGRSGWIVGSDGALLHWDGKRWSPKTAPAAGEYRRIKMVSPLSGFIEYLDEESGVRGLLCWQYSGELNYLPLVNGS